MNIETFEYHTRSSGLPEILIDLDGLPGRHSTTSAKVIVSTILGIAKRNPVPMITFKTLQDNWPTDAQEVGEALFSCGMVIGLEWSGAFVCPSYMSMRIVHVSSNPWLTQRVTDLVYHLDSVQKPEGLEYASVLWVACPDKKSLMPALRFLKSQGRDALRWRFLIPAHFDLRYNLLRFDLEGLQGDEK